MSQTARLVNTKFKAFARVFLRSRGIALNRSRALEGEVQFWDTWFTTGGIQWPDEYTRRLDPDAFLRPDHMRLVDGFAKEEVDILDVGAGPLTLLGKRHPSKRLRIVATDLLAEHYDALLGRYGVRPPVRTIFADAERLTDTLPPASFDLVHSQNALDHTAHPLRAIKQMLAVAREGGVVALCHEENEAEHQQYSQLHVWNFTVEDGRFVIRRGNKGSSAIDVASEVSPIGDLRCSVQDGFVFAEIQKRPRAAGNA
jgi:SAM-dependent methyltransferase